MRQPKAGALSINMHQRRKRAVGAEASATERLAKHLNGRSLGLNGRCLAAGAAIAAALFSGASLAQPVSTDGNGALHAQFGYHGNYQRYQLGYETPSLWHYDMGDAGELVLSVEGAASTWRASSGRQPSSLWQVAITPVLRWWWNPRYYAEAGTGPSYISRTWFAGKELSTRLQFNSFVGIGMKLARAHRLGLRYTHISNASIKRPNPGLNLLEVSYAYEF